MEKRRILVVDDEEDICDILKFNLEIEGYEVETANSAEEALEKDLKSIDLILLDVMMGEISGFKMAQIIKNQEETSSIPFIFITAKDTENDTITGFGLGADDYISKPFSIREVVLRVGVVLKRTNHRQDDEERHTYRFKDLYVNAKNKKVSIKDKDVDLTKKEFEILLLLLKKRGVILSRENILNTIWEQDTYVLDRTVDVNITRLRKKLGEYGRYIITKLGYGYGFDPESEL